MYGLPPEFDAGVFVGRTLHEVCFTENQVLLGFDGDVRISIQSSLSHQLAGTEMAPEVTTVPVSSSTLMQLVGLQVAGASADTDGTLCLTFSNDDVIYIFDDTSEYESYQLNIRGQLIVV